MKPIIPESIHTSFVTEGLADCVERIQICEIENLLEDYSTKQILNQVCF